ncbi:MAG: 2-C-methyl-D-erythritol 2,4-cyclodiphosphate synthase [Treponema sp.]|jgi:2-C-methyl-D-erythritol 2,4-cyclodiphosphate synthase|nr:2-C-methyl-D-erythritol 2,4-cyclodiphosphate synthase [Treponema sp.]
MPRIGLGRDLHRLAPGRRFLLAGVEIPCEKGELGHSDADALAHAVIDAMFGAVGMGDVGELFPDADPVYKDADSMLLLKKAFERVKSGGWRIVNLDCVITCETPKILPYREKIRAALAETLEVNVGAIMVKGKTNEGIDAIGQGNAVEVLAVCLLESV